jgi:hypothetical protein
MSYTSQNFFDDNISEKDISEFIKLLGYQYASYWKSEEYGVSKTYVWFDKTDYRSTTGIYLNILRENNRVIVETRTNESRSFYDLQHQNKTIRSLKKYLGGYFETHLGENKCMRQYLRAPAPAESGCRLAFNGFGKNLIKAQLFFGFRNFGEHRKTTGYFDIDEMNPRLLSNNLMLPFLVSIFEDYWRSSFTALLKYSEKKEAILKGGKITAEKLVQISSGTISVEEAYSDTISFARISNVCSAFRQLDERLVLRAVLDKPYKRRSISPFDTLEKMTEIRNVIIHEPSTPVLLDDQYIADSINILHYAIEKCYTEISRHKGWKFEKNWTAPQIVL